MPKLVKKGTRQRGGVRAGKSLAAKLRGRKQYLEDRRMKNRERRAPRMEELYADIAFPDDGKTPYYRPPVLQISMRR